VPAAIFVLVAGVGAVTSNMTDAPDAPAAGDATSFSLSHSGSNAETLANLKEFTRSIETEEPASTAAAGKLLPDVDTMIGRLAARLETTPDDVEGWRMLGWSYFHMGRHEEAAAAYAKAVALNPNSPELKAAYEEAKAKVSETAGSGTAGSSADEVAAVEAMPPREREAQIRSMVDGLAVRLETSPRDVDDRRCGNGAAQGARDLQGRQGRLKRD
jgi:cytochrome c-type biogenesis protein CcmH